MLKNLNKSFFYVLICSVLFFGIAQAQPTSASLWESISDTDKGGLKSIGSTVFGSEEPASTIPEVIAKMIQYLLSFLGIIFVVLVIYGGFVWMTAAGDSEKISTAKSIIISSSVGIAIVLASYSFTYFILQNLINAVQPPN